MNNILLTILPIYNMHHHRMKYSDLKLYIIGHQYLNISMELPKILK